MDITVIIVVVIVTALAFDFTNGFHDTANAVATSIATGALKPRTAVLIAGVLNLVGAFLSVQVAKTISSGLVDDTKITPTVIFAGLVGAIVWNLLTWLLGLPSSSSHALIGGLIGATWVAAGADAVKFAGLIGKVLLPAVLAPIIAGLIALIATFFAYRITARAAKDTVTKGFKLGQIVSGSMVALAHGTNDAQKTMGIITLALVSGGMLPSFHVPTWVIALSAVTAINGSSESSRYFEMPP
jgi:PiT family inorganic phosphate transporter